MSIQHMQMVFDAEGLSPREKCILLAYCNYTDPHGYVWAGVPRVSDDSGASESTVKRVRKELAERGLLASKRRVDSRTGQSTSNITRINLSLLASMKRAPREYDDNLIEELTFEASEGAPKNASDLRTGQSDPASDLRIVQSDPAPGVNLTSPKGQVNLTPNPSDEPSGSSSSGTTEEDEESPSARKIPGVRPVDLISAATDATEDEAHKLVEILRPEATKSLGGFIRRLADNGDLDHRLWLLRRERAPQARAGSASKARCTVHIGNSVPCGPCRVGLHLGGEDAEPVLAMYAALGENAAELRPDLAAHPKITALTSTR